MLVTVKFHRIKGAFILKFAWFDYTGEKKIPSPVSKNGPYFIFLCVLFPKFCYSTAILNLPKYPKSLPCALKLV
jgi:hypothetical protein